MGGAKHIKLALVDKGLTSKEFAEMAGRPYQTLLSMFSRDTMSFSTVEKFADLLGCDVVLRDRVTGKFY